MSRGGQGTVKAKMYGGPVARQAGEVLAPPPEWLYFGSEGGFCYRLDNHATPRGGGVIYRYDRDATRAKLAHLGVPLSLVAVAVSDDATAISLASATGDEGITDRPEIAGHEVGVRLDLYADEWHVYAGGELVEKVPRGDLDPGDRDAVQSYAEQVGREFIETSTAPEEPTP